SGACTALRVRRPRARADRSRAGPRGRARPRARTHARGRRAHAPPHVYRDARAPADDRGARPRPELLGERGMRIRVGHLYPDYLNIYADRGNIAVLAERARARGHELDVRAIGMGDAVPVGEIDLFYVGGGQDREQALVARDLEPKSAPLRDSVDGG